LYDVTKKRRTKKKNTVVKKHTKEEVKKDEGIDADLKNLQVKTAVKHDDIVDRQAEVDSDSDLFGSSDDSDVDSDVDDVKD
jgi:hypothetical protein